MDYWPVLAPHESIGTLHHLHVKSMFVGNIALDCFWENLLKEPDYGHLLDLPDFPNKLGRLSLVPVRLHIDEGRYTGSAKNRVITVCSITGMTHTAHPYESHLLVAVMPSNLYYKTGKSNPTNETLSEIWKFCVWSMYFMWMNVWPMVPYTGTEFTKQGHAKAGSVLSQYRFIVIAIKGDLKMLKDLQLYELSS